MGNFLKIGVFLFVFVLLGMKSHRQEIKFECLKRQHSTRMCHYNFTVDGIPHRYIDYGCKEKKEEIIKKVKAGKLALAKDWKIECPEKKDKPH